MKEIEQLWFDAFVLEMRKKLLRKESDYGFFSGWNEETLIAAIKSEVVELFDSGNFEDKELIDVANTCLMLWAKRRIHGKT